MRLGNLGRNNPGVAFLFKTLNCYFFPFPFILLFKMGPIQGQPREITMAMKRPRAMGLWKMMKMESYIISVL
jgi:hypothetical protein